ncbi:MAG: aminotransferase class I/II-fold pyridoxal phosphate-dependent enzyme [Firmicutes bacterium]|nr:aminotransferase class I/II-fold pyridoxal phosphate-dependent enzyme [Bacillota bacterium]
MELNRNLDGLRISGIRRYNALAREVGGCVLLTLGEPHFDTPRPVVDACAAALAGGATHYTENRGDAELRAKIAEFEAKTRHLSYSPDEILITAGATEAIYDAICALTNPGDEVIIPTPAFALYETVTRIAGATPVPLDTSDTGFVPSPERLARCITPKTKLLVLNSPNNPTGVIYPAEVLEKIGEIVEKTGIFVLSDDVYWGLSPCPTFPALTRLKPQILAVQSFSKPYAMTGWRIGYLMASQALADKINALHAHVLTCVSSIVQRAAIAALDFDPSDMAAQYACNREYAHSRLLTMGLPTVQPAGAFYLFPRVSQLCASDEEFCTRLIREARVALVPGSVFGAPGYARLSCCCDRLTLCAGLDRLEAYIGKL